MGKMIGCPCQPGHRVGIQQINIGKDPVIEKVLFDIFYSVLHLALAFRIRFTAEVQLKVPFSTIRFKRLCQQQVALVLIDQEHSVLVVYYENGYPVDKAEGTLVGFDGCMSRKPFGRKPDILVPRTGKYQQKEINFYTL